MTRDEAESTATRLGVEHLDRDRFSWIASEDGHGGWEVVRISAPGISLGRGSLKPSELSGRPKPAPEVAPPGEPRHEWFGG